jgi:hypothetical protein
VKKWTPTKKLQKIAKKLQKKCKKIAKKLQKNCRKNGVLEGRRSAVGRRSTVGDVLPWTTFCCAMFCRILSRDVLSRDV